MGHKTVLQIKVTGLNIFRDDCSKTIKKILLIVVIFRDTSPKFVLFSASTAMLMNIPYDIDTRNTKNNFSLFALYYIYFFKVVETETYLSNQV